MSDHNPSQLKDVSQLYRRHEGEDIYIIGTGASLRVFPADFFENKITIGLNMAWKLIPVQYGITIHPDLNIPEFMEDADPEPSITWVTKYTKSQGLLTPKQLEYAREHFYFFETDGQENTQTPPAASDAGKIVEWLTTPTPGKLYLYGSVAGTGINLAANMGAKNIILAGCDNCALGNNHHSHHQHTRWLHAPPRQRYLEYYQALCEVRSALQTRGVNLLSMNPFMGLGHIEEDFIRMCRESGQPLSLSGADISPPKPVAWKQMARKLAKTMLRRS